MKNERGGGGGPSCRENTKEEINAVGIAEHCQTAKQACFGIKLGGGAYAVNSVPWCFNRAVIDQGSHDAKIKLGSGGIRTHASEKTGALNQRLRPLGHATICARYWSKALQI